MKQKTAAALLCLAAVAASAVMWSARGNRPFKSMDAAQIASAAVHLGPPDQTIQIIEHKELVEYLRAIVVYEKDQSYREYAGQTCTFTIIQTDGAQLEITAFNPFLIIDGVGYRCEYEPCEALNRYANGLLYSS